MKRLSVIVTAVLVIAFAALAYGEMGSHGMGAGMTHGCGMDRQLLEAEHHMSKHLGALNLDEQQKAFIGVIKNRMMKEMIRRTADMRIVQIELKELISQDTVDMKAAEVKVRQLEAMKAEMYLYHIKAMEDCKTKLTPEQQKKLRNVIQAGPMMEEMGMKHDQECGVKRK